MNTKHDIDSETLARALLRGIFRARKAAMLGVLTVAMTACGAQVRLPTSEGRILIDADAKGMQAFMDGTNGLITNGKASPDQDTAHWRSRREQEKEATRREFAPSFLDKLTGASVVVPSEKDSE